MNVGLVGLDPARRVAFANSEALRVLSRGDPLGLSNGRLIAAGAEARTLSALLSAELEIGRPLSAVVDSQDGERIVLLRELDGHLVGVGGSSTVWLMDSKRAESRSAWVSSVFGLTTAEGKVVECVASGLSTEEASNHLGISIATLRTHLQRVYAKTGARNQGALVRLAMLKGTA